MMLADVDWQAVAVVASGGVVVIGGIWRGVAVPVVRWARRLERAVSAVEDQLYPNGGESLRDAVIEIQEALGLDPKKPKKKGHP